MNNMSMAQALEAWESLVESYYDQAGVMLYAYRFHEHCPSLENLRGSTTDPLGVQDRFSKIAAKGLHALLYVYAAKHPRRRIEVDGREFGDWVLDMAFLHRTWVTITDADESGKTSPRLGDKGSVVEACGTSSSSSRWKVGDVAEYTDGVEDVVDRIFSLSAEGAVFLGPSYEAVVSGKSRQPMASVFVRFEDLRLPTDRSVKPLA